MLKDMLSGMGWGVGASRWTLGFLPAFSVKLVEQVLGSEVCVLLMSKFSNDSYAQAAFGVRLCVCGGGGRTFVEKLPQSCSYQARGRGRRSPTQCSVLPIPS